MSNTLQRSHDITVSKILITGAAKSLKDQVVLRNAQRILSLCFTESALLVFFFSFEIEIIYITFKIVTLYNC